jgi:hypothetical protein
MNQYHVPVRGIRVNVLCFNKTCRYNLDGICSREEIRVDELGMCIDSRVTTQYPQEFIKTRKGKRSRDKG